MYIIVYHLITTDIYIYRGQKLQNIDCFPTKELSSLAAFSALAWGFCPRLGDVRFPSFGPQQLVHNLGLFLVNIYNMCIWKI